MGPDLILCRLLQFFLTLKEKQIGFWMYLFLKKCMSLQLLFIEKAWGRHKNNLKRMKSHDLREKYASQIQ